jgi:hypothetical protein
MDTIPVILFLSGITVTTFTASGAFFFKFYRTSRDPFYLLFCLACWLLAFERIAILIVIGPSQTSEKSAPWVYLMRLTAFTLIMLAVYNKNRQSRKN